MTGDPSAASLLIERQLHTEWCWAAVSASLDKFFKGISQTQCEIASALLKQPCCGEQPSSGQCNLPQAIAPVLESMGLLAGDPLQRQLTFDEIRHEIDAGRPICVLVKWLDNKGGLSAVGHFFAVNGYHVTPAQTQFLSITDPLYGSSKIEYTQFCNAKGGYHDGQGVWTATFRLRNGSKT